MARPTMLTTRATLLAVVIGVVALTLAFPLRLYLNQREEIAELSAQNAERQERVDELHGMAARYDDPAWVEDEARRRLHYLRPGEQAYLMPSEAVPTPTPSAVQDKGDANSTWYGNLWSELSGSGAPTTEPPTTPAP